MITGLGTDIVEIARVEKAISDSFMKKVLSIEEYERALTMSEGRRIQFLAGRFAAKEAIIRTAKSTEKILFRCFIKHLFLVLYLLLYRIPPEMSSPHGDDIVFLLSCSR